MQYKLKKYKTWKNGQNKSQIDVWNEKIAIFNHLVIFTVIALQPNAKFYFTSGGYFEF